MKKSLILIITLLITTLFAVPAFAEEEYEVEGIYPGAPYADIASYDGRTVFIPEKYIFDEDKLTGTVELKICSHWENGEIVPPSTEEVDNYIIIWRNGKDYYVVDIYEQIDGEGMLDNNQEWMEDNLKDELSSCAASLFHYPTSEIVSINGKPWQETEWKDYIIKETKRRLKKGDKLLRDELLWEVFVNPEYNGYAEEAYEKLKAERNKEKNQEEQKEQQKTAEFKGSGTILQLGSKKVTVIKNGGTEGINTLDIAPQAPEGRTLIPLRGVLDELGAELSYNGIENQVTVTAGNQEVILNIGQKKAVKAGKTIKMEQPAVIKNGRTLIPLRFIGEQLGYIVHWDEETQKITVTK